MLIALLLTLCPVLSVFYMARCMRSDVREVIQWADARHPEAPAPTPPAIEEDPRPLYDVVELDPRLVALMKRDGFL